MKWLGSYGRCDKAATRMLRKWSFVIALALCDQAAAQETAKEGVQRTGNVDRSPSIVTSARDGVAISKPQAPASFRAFRSQPNGEPVNIYQAMVLNGTVIESTRKNFLATATPDNVAFSGWGIRGGAGSNPLVVSNFGAWFENNTGIVWAQEIDVNNEGSTQAEGSDSGGVGIALNTGSTFSPDTAISIRRTKGAGSGPGFLRGLVIEGVRNTGIRIIAMDNKTYPDLKPSATGRILALQIAKSSDGQSRMAIDENGTINWGDGSNKPDVAISRTAPGVLSISGAINDSVTWTDYSPSCAVKSGELEKYEAKGRFNRIGTRVFFNINIRATKNGNKGAAIVCTLPLRAKTDLVQTASGVETGVRVRSIAATLADKISIFSATGTYPAVNGSLLALSGVYEAEVE